MRLALAGLAVLPVGAAPLAPVTEAANVLREREARFHSVWSRGGMVAADEPRAGAVGAAVLRQGGNAVDAAVATAFALAVTHPQAGNLGGGGFLLLWLPGPSPAARRGCLPRGGGTASGDDTGPELRIGPGSAVAVNFREAAPLAARADLFLTSDGRVDRDRATRSLLSTAVPGSVAGLALAQRCYGRMPLARVVAPAIDLAERGFAVNRELSDSLRDAAGSLAADPTARGVFLRSDGPGRSPRAHRPGEWLRQPELAGTLRRIAAQGAHGFYRGPVAEALVRLMREQGGLIRADDLLAYRPRLARPLVVRFRGHPVLSMPPPGSGVTLLQLLKLLEPLELGASGANSAATLHPLVEAMNLAYRDRNALLGDPERIAIPIERMLDDGVIAATRRRIDPLRHRPAAAIASEPPPSQESVDTTHLSVADRDGGLVALTTTINFPYGNGIAVPGAGFLLNNEMDDFTASPGRPNAFGLVQGASNAIAPGRRPLSSMAPTLVFRPGGEPWLATGSPGGSRIITTVLQVLLNRIVFGLNLATAVAAPRIHSQLWPDRIDLEEGVSPDSRRLLEAMGHTTRLSPAMGAANSVEVLWPMEAGQGGRFGIVDPRRAQGPAVGE